MISYVQFCFSSWALISQTYSQDVLFLLGGTCPFWTEVALSLCYWFRLDTVNRCKLLKEVEEALWKAWTKESLFLDDGKWWLQEAWNFSDFSGSTRRDCSDM